MAKQLNVNLGFTADTSQAKKQLQDLQSALTNLLNSTNKNAPFGLTKSIQEASALVSTLKVQLQEATNVNTGKLDLSAFNSSLQKSNLSIGQYKDALLKLGPSGAQTFSQLAQAITTAEVPLRRGNALLSEFATTLKNTARWQISSSILHGFIGSLQSAYGYAQDLNQSLNNIRIVTGYSNDQMAKFAEQANKAAQSLSTTTTRYTDAALIYYQQGLSDEEVLGRAETTIKLANVSRQSTEEVSDQLTAIWNNFYDGSQNLEYYADVITALGAATASSSEEISTGLEKFAAVSKTVGLSYEYATAALATITATTRQSADTVGTGLRTLFSRLEGLKLGETLEDGVDLNKYSAALQSVGVQVLDTSGNLRQMDDILEDLGGKWEQLSQAQKMALAQTVGGVRQYTNLIALMDNWDFMQENLATAKGAEGTLQEQADIYAESWEAAQKRVRAAAEDIYKSLLNDKFFIELNNGFAGVLKQIGNIIEGIGGFKGVLITLGTIALNVFNKQITSSLDNLVYSITMLTEQGRQSVYKLRDDTNKELTGLFKNDKSFGGQSISAAYASQSTVQSEYLKAAQNMTEEQQKIAQILLDQHNTLVQNVIAQSNLTKEAEKEANLQQRKSLNSLPKYSEDGGTDRRTMSIQQRSYLKKLKESTTFSSAMDSAFGISSPDLDQLKKEIPGILERINNLRNGFVSTKEMIKSFGSEGAIAFTNFAREVEAAGDDPKKVEEALNKLYEAIGKVQDKTNTAREVIEGYGEEVIANMAPAEQATRQAGEAAGRLAVENANLSGSTRNFAESLEQIPSIVGSQTASLVSFGQKLSTVAMGINTIINLGKTWSNTDLSFGEKMLQTMTSLSMIIPLVTTALGKDTISKIANTMATKLHKVAEDADTTSIIGNTAATVANYLAHAPLLAIILALTTAIVALTTVVYLVAKAYNKSADDAKKASEASKGLKEQYQKTKESYEELKKSVEDHENAVKAIDKLKYGTEEWRDAIQEANEKVLELIGNYPQLAAAINRNKDGILTIDQNSSAYQTYLEEEKKRMDSSFAGSVAGDIIANNANYTNDLVQAGRKMWYQNGTTQMQGEEIANYSQVSEAQLRQAVDLFNKDNSLFAKGQEDKLAEALNTTNTNLCTALINNVSAIEKLATELSANTTANQLAAEQIGMAAFKQENPEVDDKYVQAVSGMLGGNYEEALEKANAKYADTGKFGSGPTDEEVQKKYADAMGYTWKKNLSNNMGRYTDDKGQVIEIDDAVAREYLAIQEATAEISGNLNSANQAIKNLQIGAKNLGNEIGDKDSAFEILTGTSNGKDFNFSELTEKQFEGIKKAWKAASKDGSMTGEEFLKYFGISDEYAKSKGYKSGLAMAQAFENGINNYANDVKYKNILESLMPTAKTFEEASESYNTITSAGSNIKEDNSIIDDKSYQALAEAGIAVDAYFEQMADGTHQLIVDASEFKRVVQDIAMKDMYDAAQNSANQTVALNNLSAAEGYSSRISDNDKDSILQLAGVSDEDIANIKMIEDSVARTEAYAEKFNELGITGNTEKINELFEKSAENSKQIQDAINNTNFKNDVERYGLNLEETTQYAKELEEQFKNTGKSESEITKASRDLAISNQRLDKGLNDLNDNLKKYEKALKSSNKGTAEYSRTMGDFKDSLSDVLNVADGDMLSDTFAESFLEGGENAEKLKEALDGDADAILELRMAAADDIVANLVVNHNLDVTEQEIATRWDIIKGIIENNDINAPGFDQTQLINSFNDLIQKGQMTKEEIEAALAGLHVSANVKTNFVEQTVSVPTYDEYSQAEMVSPAEYEEVDGVRTLKKPSTWKRTTWTVQGPSIETTGYVPQYELEGTEGAGGITSGVTALPPPKASGGSTTSGKGGKSGGGGGGGGKGSKPKTKEKTKIDESKLKKEDDEIERYHRIRNELEDITHELTMIGKAKDRAFGRNKIKQLDAETASLKKQSAAQQRYLQEIQGWLEKDNAKAREFGFEVDATGLVTNYEENMRTLMNKADEEYKAHVAKLNEIEEAYDALSAAGDESAEEVYKEAKRKEDEEFEKLEKYYEDAKKALAKQEETHDLLLKTQEELKDTENAIYDNGVYRITYAVELKIDVKDRDIALLQDLLEDIGDKADGACDAIANFGNQLEDTLDKVDTYTQSVSDILENAGADQDLIDKIMNHDFDESDWEDVLAIGQNGEGLNEDEIDHLKSVADALLESNKEMRKLREEALKKTGEAFDEFNEQLDRSVGQIEHLTTVTQTYRDVLDIVGKDVLDRNGKLTDALNKQTYNIQRNHTHALQAQLDFIDTALDKAQALYDEAVENGYNQQTLESLKADVEKYEDERQATYEEWLESWKQECQIAKDYYEDTLNQILSDFEDAVAGQFKNLSGLSEEFARKNEIADIYVEDYEKIYQLSKLNRDINNSLDDSTTLASKSKLRDIQKEINELQESGVEVSQYDLDVLRKKYEMALAYEQWQDAQNAKTVVRMQRDNEGNYGYVYTADQSDVEAAEQNYEDKLHEMQVLNAEYIQNLQEQIIQAQQDCADALANLRAEDFASYEEYQDAVEQIRKDYTKRIETLSQQMENAMDNNRTLYEEDWTAYSQATGYKISADEDYIDRFDETVYAQLTGFETMQEAQNAFVDAVNDASDQAAENWEDWYIRTNTALDDAGLSMQNYADEVGDRVEQLGEEAERAEEDVWNMSDEFSDAYSNISDTVASFLDEYSNYIDAMIDANQALIDSINQVIAAYAELSGMENGGDDMGMMEPEEIDADWEEQWDAAGNLTGWKAKDKATGQYITGENKKVKWAGNDQIAGYTASYNFDSSGLMQTNGRNEINTGFGGTTFTDEEKKKYYKIASGATGMYTGDWGDNSGKLAILHKKELVLNTEDTSNILSAVDMIRSISSAIDLNALAASSAFASPNVAYKSSFGTSETLEQNVHISAEFPNVSDHNEIEEALNNLVERAAQFAGRKKF